MILMKCIRLLHALRRIDHSVGAPNSTKSLKQRFHVQIHVTVPTLLTKILIKTTMATQWQRSNRLGKLEPKRRDHILTKEQKKYCHFQRFWRYGDKGIWLVGKVRWSKFLGFKDLEVHAWNFWVSREKLRFVSNELAGDEMWGLRECLVWTEFRNKKRTMSESEKVGRGYWVWTERQSRGGCLMARIIGSSLQDSNLCSASFSRPLVFVVLHYFKGGGCWLLIHSFHTMVPLHHQPCFHFNHFFKW